MAIDFEKQAIQQRAAGAQRTLFIMQSNLAGDEQRFAEISRSLVSALGVLKKAEAAQQKLGVNATVENKLEQIRAEIDSLRKREDIAGRIVKAAKALIEKFLDEGTPSNRDLLAASKEYESAMAEVF